MTIENTSTVTYSNFFLRRANRRGLETLSSSGDLGSIQSAKNNVCSARAEKKLIKDSGNQRMSVYPADGLTVNGFSFKTRNISLSCSIILLNEQFIKHINTFKFTRFGLSRCESSLFCCAKVSHPKLLLTESFQNQESSLTSPEVLTIHDDQLQ